jgi:hypothetical protein
VQQVGIGGASAGRALGPEDEVAHP